MISTSVSHGTMPSGRGASTSFLVSLFILIFGLTSVLSAQSAPRGASGDAMINAETWDDLGGGVTGEVFAITQMGNYLYVGGDITAAGGNPVNNIARFDLVGSGGWQALGLGVDGRVNSLVAHNGVLYVGGDFEQVDGVASTYFATFDGTNWSSPTDQPVLTGLPGKVSAMLVLDGYVYVGGDFDAIGDLSTKTMARYSISEGTWEAVTPSANFFSGVGCSVIAMATDGTSIYVSVPCAAEISGQSYSGLFSYTPGTQTWAPVGEGLDETSAPLSLAVDGNYLYAGGYGMYIGDLDSTLDIEFFGRYDLVNDEIGWASLGNPLDAAVNDFEIVDGSAYVVGEFVSLDESIIIGMAVFNIDSFGWTSIGDVGRDNEGINRAIALVNNQLVVGGVINNAGGTTVSNVARYSQTFSGGGSGGDGGGDGGDGGTPTFTLTAPTDGLTGVSVEPLFTWNAPVGVTVDYYMIEIYTSSDLSGSPEFQFGSITTNSYKWGSDIADPILFGNTTYYWIVKAYDSSGTVVAETAQAFSFTTASLVLSTPTLFAPADGDTDVSLTPTFTWSKDALAESYVLEYSAGATLSDTPTQVNLTLAQLTEADPNYSYTLPEGSELESNTQYSWRVIAQKAGEDDMPSAEASFTTVDLSPSAFTWDFDPLERIVDGSIGTFNTSWTQSDGATSYELDFKIGEQPFTAFGDPVVVNAPTTSYSVDNTKLIDGFTYTVELTAVNEFGRTSADPLTIVYTPTKPVAVSPKDGAAVDATTSFTWESTENFGIIPGNVLVQILYTNDESADPVTNSTDGIQFDFLGTTDVEESKTMTELFATQNDVDVTHFLEANMGNTLYWRVSNKSIRINEADAETQREVVWSDLASFSVPAPPQAFSLSTPTNNSTVETFLPTFTWQQSQNATSYKLQIATQTNFSDPVYESPLIGRGDDENTVTYTLPEGEELDFLTGYFWRVIASSDGGDLTSGHLSFETYFGRDIEIVSPDDGLTYESVAQAGAAEYSWPHIFGDADEFYYATQFFIDEDRVFSNTTDEITEGNVIGDNPSGGLRSGFTYNWYADGYASYSGSRFTPTITSDSRSFTIEAEKPTVTAPVAQTLLASNTTFSWSAEETIYLMEGGAIEGDFDIQLLTVNDPNADPQTNPEDGYHFTMRGLSLELNESNTLDGLVSLNENVTLDDILSREGETLYFRVRIYPEYSLLTQERVTLWSDLIPVRVPAMPRAFNLLTPADELSEVSNTPTFTWEQSQFADTYVLNVSLNEDLSNPVFPPMNLSRGEDLNEVSFTLPTEDRLLFGQTYFWQVTAIGTGGEIKSGIGEFSTLPEGIVLTSPEEGKVFASAQELEDETFTWETYSNAEDIDDVTVVFILLFKDQSSEYSRLDYLTTRGITSRSIRSTNLGHGFTYLWEIGNSYNSGSTTISTASERRTFSLSPEKPVLSGPIDGAVFTSSTPFEWTTEERFNAGGLNNVYYEGEFHVQILFDESTDAEQLTADQGYQFLVDGTDELTESFTLEQLFATLEGDDAPTIDDVLARAGETLYWRVMIDPEYSELEQDREVVWSDVESFVIGTLPWEIVFESAEIAVPQYELSEPIVVEIQDAFGNPVRNGLPASLSIESTDNISVTDLNGSAITSLQINPDGSVSSFRVKATNHGQATFTISGEGFNPKNKQVIITPFSGGSGIETDPYIITNVHQLQTVSEFNANHFALGKDIDASETAHWNDNKGFDPIDYLMGSFDGRTFSIMNLNINRPEEYNVGLFSENDNSYGEVNLKNITLKGVNIVGQFRVGGIAGSLKGSSISNSWVDGSITATFVVSNNNFQQGASGGLVGYGEEVQILSSATAVNLVVTGDLYAGGLVGGIDYYSSIEQSHSTSTIEGNDYVGGLVGLLDNTTISNSYFEGSATGNFSVGGIAGYTVESLISRSWSSGSVVGMERVGGIAGNNDEETEINLSFSSSNVTGESQVGGLVGMNDDFGKVVNSFATGSVTGKNEVGGLVGHHYAGSAVTNSYSTGKVQGEQSVGGLVGIASDAVVSSFWDTQTSGQEESDGGTGKTTANMKARSTFTDVGWDFNGIWTIDPFKNNGYPYLIGVGSFESEVPGVDPPVLNTPVETDVFTFSWSGDETASYVFEIDENKTNLESAGPSAKRDDITFAGTASGNSLELALGRLSAGTTYYWRVSLVVKSGDNTAFVISEVGEFTPAAVPSVITVTSPASTDLNVPVSGINFSWEPDANATQYQVLVYESTNLNAPVIDRTIDAIGDNTGIQSVQFNDVPALKYSTIYSWRVIGYNGTKRGELNEMSSFKTRPIIEGGGVVATKLLIVRQLPTTGKVGQALPPITIAAVDAANKLVETVNGIVTMTSNGNGFSARNVPMVNGVATFENVIFQSASVTGYTITFTFGTLTVSSTPIRISAAGPDELAVTSASSYVTRDVAFNVEVRVVDASGFLLENDSETSITATLSGSTAATLTGTTTKKVVDGIARFNDLKISGTGTYTLTFSATGFSSISGNINVLATAAAVATQMVIEQAGSSTMSFPIKKSLALGICRQLSLSAVQCSRLTASNNSTSSKTLSGAAGSEISNENDGLLPLLWGTPQDSLFLEFPVTHYAIEFRESGTENWTVFARPQSPDTVAVITGLKLNTSYDARVAFVTELGASEFSEPVTFETLDLQTILDFIDDVADEIIATSIEVEEIPTEFTLFQNYPNPFNPTTTVRFALPEPSEVQLEVYSILGQRIAVLSAGLKPAGYHSLQLDASRWASGTYVYRLRAGDRVFTKKLLLLK